MTRLRLGFFTAALLMLSSLASCTSDDTSPPAATSDSGAADAAGNDADASVEASPDAADAGDESADASDAASEEASEDAAEDAGSEASTDAEAADGEEGDAGLEAGEDGGEGDADAGDAACLILPGLGQAYCECDGLDDSEWNSTSPFLFENRLDFGAAGWVPTLLTPGGQKILADGNLGGSSLESEVAAYEMLARCDFGTVLKSEGEIVYKDVGGKKTDILVLLDGRKIGVSVMRAYHYPPPDPYTAAEAAAILTKKLSDIPLSAANAAPQDAWERSMLSVLAWDQQHADMIKQEWAKLDPTLRGDVIIMVTVTDGDDAIIY
jgi:hypothetical protein